MVGRSWTRVSLAVLLLSAALAVSAEKTVDESVQGENMNEAGF
jgi:hypothetical protein